MKTSLLVIDDFLPDPMGAREIITAGEFKDFRAEGGHVYPGISQDGVNDIGGQASIEACMGFPIDPKLTFARVNPDKEMPGTLVHADLLYADWAAILYLNTPEQCRGGTAFWTHKALGIDRMPDHGDPIIQPDAETWRTWMRAEWDKKDSWRMSGFVEMRFNRCAIYRTSMFHSRWPWEGWGSGNEGARCVWVCFFSRR